MKNMAENDKKYGNKQTHNFVFTTDFVLSTYIVIMAC